jgi:hypothetical protein
VLRPRYLLLYIFENPLHLPASTGATEKVVNVPLTENAVRCGYFLEANQASNNFVHAAPFLILHRHRDIRVALVLFPLPPRSILACETPQNKTANNARETFMIESVAIFDRGIFRRRQRGRDMGEEKGRRNRDGKGVCHN